MRWIEINEVVDYTPSNFCAFRDEFYCLSIWIAKLWLKKPKFAIGSRCFPSIFLDVPVGTVWLDSKCLQFESLSRHVYRSFIIYTLGLKQFSHLRLWRRRFRLFWVNLHNSTCDSLLWRMSRVCASMLTCLCSSGILHGSPKSKYSRFRKQSKAFIVCLHYVWRIL